MSEPSPDNRIACDDVDVLVVGGGIVGAGVARDAAMRGLRVALVEKDDFASGTSSRSSRLLHGGLRYLAQGRLGLVREASVEKVILHRIAPHLAQPMPFIFPTRHHSDWPRWKLSIGVKLYDLLCGGRNLGKSRTLSRDETIARLPAINPDRLSGAVRYFDGFTNDARLVLDTLRSAAQHGAKVFNYASLIKSQLFADGWTCHVQDQLVKRNIARIKARVVVNATGAWADLLPASRVPLRLTKGVHLVIDHARLPIDDAVVMADGKRILFAIPWGRRVILGTTDTDFQGDRDHPTVDPQDIEYILRITIATFPAIKLARADIRSTWAGLRPLIDGGQSGAPSDISRKHLIEMPEPGWIDVAGGKLTTYRLMAEQTVDRIVSYLKIPAPACATAKTPLLACSPFSGRACEARPAGHAWQARPLNENAPPAPTTFTGILPPEVSRDAVEHFCRHEWASHLADIMLRRTSWQHYLDDPDTVAEQISHWMAKALEWDPPRREEELARYREQVKNTRSVGLRARPMAI
jgi:glycerol-3-phosphate dehydrogenase